MKALTSSSTWAVFASLTVALALSVVPGQAQTPGQIPMFDQPGTGSCNVPSNNNCVDSVIYQDANGNIGIGTTNPFRLLTIGPDFDPAFTLEPSDFSPNAGYIRFGDQTGWKLHFGRSREFSAGPLNTGLTGVLMTIQDNGSVGIGTTGPSAKVHVLMNTGATVGVLGESTFTAGVEGTSTFAPGVRGATGNPSQPGVFAIGAGGLSTNLGLIVGGRFQATGTKNAVVPLQDGQHVLLTAEESTEVWFSDYGTVQLVNGRATVQIDRTYLQTVNTEKDYHVFLTARGSAKGTLYIDQETPSSFEIRESTGTANIKVSYRIVAKRKDFADERMKKIDAPLAYREPTTKTVVAGTASGGIVTERH